MWFEDLMGFREKSPKQTRENLSLHENHLTSSINGRTFTCGFFETPSLEDLRNRADDSAHHSTLLSVQEMVANVQHLHMQTSNSGALFQVASQFNTLEMVSPNITPEQGVARYQYDHTQGPACAIAAGAGTVYRNYFVPIHDQIGQTSTHQLDCLADMGAAFGNSKNRLWKMKNGYALAHKEGLIEITNTLNSATKTQIDDLRKLLRIGIQWNTEVTLNNSHNLVTQAYCSALPVAYSRQSPSHWAAFAQLVLEATYEATLCAAILNFKETGNNKVYLTLIGGGAFGNKTEWILKALYRCLNLYKNSGLDVFIVSYGHSNPKVQKLIHQFEQQHSK